MECMAWKLNHSWRLTNLIHLLTPSLYLPSIFAIDLDKLVSRGIRGLILDLDNTLIEWNAPLPNPPLVQWVAQVRGKGLLACIVSNNRRDRVTTFARDLGIPAIPSAGKPRRGAFREAMKLMGTSPDETAVIGDQIFTDVLGGNRLGLHTILVVPITRREFVGTRFVRRIERLVLGYLTRKGSLSNE